MPLERMYPEIAAGGFSRRDGTVQFYTRVRALMDPNAVVLDLGAGRGQGITDDPSPYRRRLRTLRGDCARLIGVDVDEVVLDNPGLDEAHVTEVGGPLPLDRDSVDVVVSDYVFEHVTDPDRFASEIERVLRPGGWLCARTPSRWSPVGVATSLIPNALHARVLRHAQQQRKERDVFPTVYHLNTRRAIRRAFPAPRWQDHTYGWTGEPVYHFNSRLLAGLLQGLDWGLGALAHDNLFVFLRRRGPAA